MDNEEKATKIAQQYCCNLNEYICDIESERECFNSAFAMAEWKDEQFISMLPDIFDFFVNNIGLYDGSPSHEDTDKPLFVDEFTKRILNKN